MISALSFGEILWDIIEGEAHIGGATFNLAAHLSKMGAEVYMISSLGEDDLGFRAFERAKDFGIRREFITFQSEYPTGTVDVFLDSGGHPDYTIHEDTAWDNLDDPMASRGQIVSREWDVFCFGTIAQRTQRNREVLASVIDGIQTRHTFYDMNLRQSYHHPEWIESSLSRSSIVKLNDDEAAAVARMLGKKTVEDVEDLHLLMKTMAADYDIDVVIVTRGNTGAVAYKGGRFFESICADVDVVDTVGAGDSFSAGFLFAYLSGHDVDFSVQSAGKIADFVVTRRGAIPEYTDKQRSELSRITGG